MPGKEDANARSENSLISVAIESWRLSRLFVRALEKLDASDAARYLNQIRYFQKKLENTLDDTGLALVSIEGTPYDAGAAVVALNLEDFEPQDVLLVDQMIEPIVMGPDGLKKEGAVLLRKMHR